VRSEGHGNSLSLRHGRLHRGWKIRYHCFQSRMANSAFNPAYYQQLRQWRTRPDTAVPVGELAIKMVTAAKRESNRAGAAGQTFNTCCPGHLRPAVTAVTLRAGVLVLRVPDAAARFELDRWLRCGGRKELLAAAIGTLVAVRIGG